MRPIVVLLMLAIAPLLCADDLKGIREQGMEILKLVRKDVEKNYFDPGFGGVDMALEWKRAEAKMKEAQSTGHTFGIIAQSLSALNDSHTFFIPPSRVSTVRFPWRMALYGETCMVSGVRPGSDAEKQGLRAGDRLLAIEGFTPDRKNLWRMEYMFLTLQPRPALRLAVASPDGRTRELLVQTDVKTSKRIIDLANDTGDYEQLLREEERQEEVNPHRTESFGKDLLVYHMPDFYVETPALESVMKRASEHKNFILDLRGNGGGSVETLEYAVGYLMGRDLNIASRKARKEEKPIRSRGPSEPLVKTPLVVLVDSKSGSAAELLARVVQLEGRGKVIGDRTSGSVRQSRRHSEKLGMDRIVPFGVSVTNADLYMKDGKSLEHEGVVPDETSLPTAEDLAAGRDPVLSKAAESLGVKLTPEQAGRLFPRKWLVN